MKIGFTGLLTILFIALKLLHYIDWSWWWVLAPLWGSIALYLIILLGALITLRLLSPEPRKRGKI